MLRGVLFIGGRGPDPVFLKGMMQEDDIVCAADSGLDAALAAGIHPDCIVGDMDSISDISLLEQFPPDSVKRYPVDKDETDTDLGLDWLRSQGCQSIVLVGGGEGRLDHTMALLNLFGRPGHPEVWYTAVEEIQVFTGEHPVSGQPGDSISIAAVGSGPWQASSHGLQWPLNEVNWDTGGISLSNRISANDAIIEVESGTFLSMRPLEDV